jgi:Spy/CpxP family protein refolding chaperone
MSLDRDTKEKATMRKKAMILASLAAALLVAASMTTAFAQPPDEHRGRRGPGHDRGRDVTEFLGLTEEQREAWREAQRSHFEAQRPTFEKIREVREQLRNELESSSPDAATVGGYVISIHQLDDDVEASRDELENALREILTDEQRTRYDAWKAAHPGPRRGSGPPGHGPRHGHPPGAPGGAGDG